MQGDRTSALLSLAAGPRPVEAILRLVVEAEPRRWTGGAPRTELLRTLNLALTAHPQSEACRDQLRQDWLRANSVRMLAEMGLPQHTDFLREAFKRLVDRYIPRLDESEDLFALLESLRLDESDAQWLESSRLEDLTPWKELLALPVESYWDAAQLVGFRCAALGLSRDLLGLGPEARELDSPFSRLPEALSALRSTGVAAATGWNALLDTCRERLSMALAHLDEHGVSSDLVYRLDLLEIQLKRLEKLVGLALGEGDGLALAALLIRMGAEQRSLSGLVRGTLRRLARKVVEHTGETGEHYVAQSRKEWWRTLGSGGGGGALTAFTAAVKYSIAALPFAPMPIGLLLAANYAASFILMQFCHFTLASKQPAMTASALAGALENQESAHTIVGLSEGITRSQVAATLGNVLVTIPATLLLDLAWKAFSGHPVLTAERAAHGLNDLHPVHSWAIPFAALTGVLLWLASLAAGWAGNWSAYRRFPDALAANPRIRRWLGPEQAARLAPLVEHHFSGIVGYLVLGLLLGLLPLLLAFMGLPVEVRHVTLSAASLALCILPFHPGGAIPWADVAWGLAGIGAIGVMNFGVSFGLALITAERARGLDSSARRKLGRTLRTTFAQRPIRFFFPPKD